MLRRVFYYVAAIDYTASTKCNFDTEEIYDQLYGAVGVVLQYPTKPLSCWKTRLCIKIIYGIICKNLAEKARCVKAFGADISKRARDTDKMCKTSLKKRVG